MKTNFLSLAKRIGWMAGFTFFYFYIIRPIRAFYSKNIIHEWLFNSQYSIGNITSAFHSPRQLIITYVSNGNEIVMTHIPQFGFFFLFAMLGVIFFLPSKRVYLALVGFQVVVEMMVLLLLWIGIHVTIIGFILSDFLMVYFSPLICLGFVVYLSMRRRSN